MIMNLKRIIREKIENEFKWIDDTPSSVRGEDLIGYYFTHEEEISSRKFFITKVYNSHTYTSPRSRYNNAIQYVWWERGNPPNTHPYKSNMFLDTFILRVHNGDYKLYDQDGNYISPQLLVDSNSDEEYLNESEMSWMEDTQPTFLEKLKVATEMNSNVNVIFDEYIPHRGQSHIWVAPKVSITDKRGKTYFTNEDLYWNMGKEDFLDKVVDALGAFNNGNSDDEEDFKELYSMVDSLIMSEGVDDDFKWIEDTESNPFMEDNMLFCIDVPITVEEAQYLLDLLVSAKRTTEYDNNTYNRAQKISNYSKTTKNPIIETRGNNVFRFGRGTEDIELKNRTYYRYTDFFGFLTNQIKENELKWLQDTGTSLKLTVDDLEIYYGEKFITEKERTNIYHLEKFYEDEFEWIKDGTKVKWYDPEEEYRDLERVWIIKDYDRYLEDTQPFSSEDIDDLPINIESEDGYSEVEVFLREIKPIEPIKGVVNNDRVNVCWEETRFHNDNCTSYFKTNVVSYFNNSDWIFLSMTNVNESNEFDWIENIEPTTIHTRNEKFQSYMDNEFEVTHIINHLAHNMDMFSELGEYLRKVAPDDWDPMGIRMLSMDDNLAGNRFLGMAFFTSFLNEDILEKVFGSPINHSEFGEGFETNRDYWYSSYIIEINGHLYHVGYDHRGTAFEPDVTTSYDDVMKDAKSLIDHVFKKI